jgi:hypothetical protein
MSQYGYDKITGNEGKWQNNLKKLIEGKLLY